ncbi:MAG TPA: MFS transporter [Gaiellaceae bacterium]|nr:MFS transporter [Gaiellaceae bacterium]
MASQALLVVLAPTITAIGDDFGASVAAVGQARSVTAAVAIATSLFIAARIGVIGVSRLLVVGSLASLTACAAVGLAPNLWFFLGVHVLVALGFACLLSAAFAGVLAFPPEQRAWAVGYVAGANALTWVVVSPEVGVLTEWVSWRAAEAVPAVLALGTLALAPHAGTIPCSNRPMQLRLLTRDVSARRWLGSETVAFASWTALLTFVGAFFIDELGVGEAAAGVLLALGAAAYVVSATRSGPLAARHPRRLLVATSALAMAVILPLVLTVGGRGVALGLVLFALACLAAGVRTPASSGLGLEQLPDHPGSMAGARTAVTQLGYLLGAAGGGAVIALSGYAALGVALGIGMALSAVLVLRVWEPVSSR